MKSHFHVFFTALLMILGLSHASAQTELKVTPLLSNPAAIAADVQFILTSDWQVTGTAVTKTTSAAGVPLWTMDAKTERSLIAIPPTPLKVNLRYELGAMAPGTTGRLLWKLNGKTYSESNFTVPKPDPGPDINARVTSGFISNDKGTTAHVKIVLPNPYFAMTDPGKPIISGDIIRINATMVPIATLVALPSPKIIEQDYDLGSLAPGIYTFKFAATLPGNPDQTLQTSFRVAGSPAAPVQLAFVEVQKSAPSATGATWSADLGVVLTDPAQTITSWGDPKLDGKKFTVNLTTGPRPTNDPLDDGGLAGNPVLQGQAFVELAGDAIRGGIPFRIVRHRYDLGALADGTYQFEVSVAGKSIGVREFKTHSTPIPPGPLVAGIGISKTSAGPWEATVRLVVPPGQTVVDWGAVKQDGSQFKVSLKLGPDPAAGGDIPGLPPVRSLQSHTYPLGVPANGTYSFAVCQGDNQLALSQFRVETTPPPPLNQPGLAFIEIKQGPASAAAEVGVLLPQPGYSITSWGEVTRDGRHLKANVMVKVDEVIAAVVLPPSLERHLYSLGSLEAGEYKLTICYQTAKTPEPKVLGARSFSIRDTPPPPGDPLPLVACLADGWTNEQGFYIDLCLAWPQPGLMIRDWGNPVLDGNSFKATLVTGKQGPGIVIGAGGDAHDPNAGLPDPVREIGGWPTHLEKHRYQLGKLRPGVYKFVICIGSQVLASHLLTVRDDPSSKPLVSLMVEAVRMESKTPAPFTLTFTARTGWPVDPTLGKVTVKGPRDFQATAKRLSGGIISMDPLGILARGEYEITPPGDAWDAADNGRYEIFIDPAVVKDRQGQSPVNPVGTLLVQILPTPPPPPPALKVDVEVAMADGKWRADVSFANTGGWWQAEWGHVKPRGSVHFAEATLTVPPPFVKVALPDAFSHTYELGELKPGFYSFLFLSSAGHIGQTTIKVPGVASPSPLDDWKFNLFGAPAMAMPASDDWADEDQDCQPTLAEYALGSHPLQPDAAPYRAEIQSGPDGAGHLALVYQRALGSESSVDCLVELSSNLKDWQPGGSLLTTTVGTPNPDGTQSVCACQTAPLALSRYPFMRLRFQKKD